MLTNSGKNPGCIGETLNLIGKLATGASVRKNVNVNARLPIEEPLPVSL
jgi:hypothetical protein